MNRPKPLFIAAITCVAVVGCQKPVEPAKDNTGLKASDIAQALGMTWWEVQLPADLEPDDLVDVAYKHADGSIEGGGGRSNWDPGTTVKVFVWDGDDGTQLRYAVFDETGSFRGSLQKKPNMTGVSPFSEGKLVRAGDALMKFSENTISASPDVRPGEVGLILHVTKGNGAAPAD